MVTQSAGTDLRDKLSLDATACLTIRRPGADCAVCAETCPAQAIAIDARVIELDHDRCTGCTRCVAVCPTGALALPVPFHKTSTALILECSRVTKLDQQPGAQDVSCLGGLSAPKLLEHVARHGQVTLVDRGWCADCPSGGSTQPWANAVELVQADLAYLGQDAGTLQVFTAPIDSERAKPAPQPRRPRQQDYSRRQLFRRLTTPTPVPNRRRVTTDQPFSGKVNTPALERRRDVLHALHGAGSLPAELFPMIACSGTPDLRLAASLCPTHALTLTETAEADCLTFDAALCIGCGDCEKADGLHLHPLGAGQYDRPVTLVRQTMADCPGCQRRFAPHAAQSKCDACHKDNDLAASAFGLMRRTQVPYGA